MDTKNQVHLQVECGVISRVSGEVLGFRDV